MNNTKFIVSKVQSVIHPVVNGKGGGSEKMGGNDCCSLLSVHPGSEDLWFGRIGIHKVQKADKENYTFKITKVRIERNYIKSLKLVCR